MEEEVFISIEVLRSPISDGIGACVALLPRLKRQVGARGSYGEGGRSYGEGGRMLSNALKKDPLWEW